jgi:hypothetical protein
MNWPAAIRKSLLLSDIDRSILYFFNHDLANPVFDVFFITITDSRFLKAVIAILVLAFAWKGGPKGRLIAILAIVCVTFTDLTNHYVRKRLFCRLRPTHALSGLRLPMGFGGKQGYVSN